MHKAPAVLCLVGRLRMTVMVLSGVWLSGVAVCVFWGFQADPNTSWYWLGGAMFVGGAAVVLLSWRLTSIGILRFDGSEWWWESGGSSTRGVLVVHFDFQRVMLVRLDTAGRFGRWLWIAESGDKPHWTSFRRALFAQTEVHPGGSDSVQPHPR